MVFIAHRRLSVSVRHQRVTVIHADRQALRWRSSPTERNQSIVVLVTYNIRNLGTPDRGSNLILITDSAGFRTLSAAESGADKRRRFILTCKQSCPDIHARFGICHVTGAADCIQRSSVSSDEGMLLLFPACASSACRKTSGNSRPLDAARRSIPRQAVGLK